MSDADRYEAYYADKLWSLLPGVYRNADAVDEQSRGPLRELVERIATQAAVVRRSTDRLWEDQSIETCDDWLIPYLAELVATNLVAGLDASAQRLDVAKTIYYRRRKGTLAVLEELAHDVTQWGARATEFFRRLGRTRHGLDPELGWPLDRVDPGDPSGHTPSLPVAQGLLGQATGTPAGGFADLRHAYGASRAAFTAFDESSHTVDVRRGQGRVGWHNISRLGIFVWRLKSALCSGVDPVAYQGCAKKWTFDPTGRELPLFALAVQRRGDAWVAAREHELPGPISSGLLASALPQLYARPNPARPDELLPNALGVFAGTIAAAALVPVSKLSADLRASGLHRVDPERGILYLSDALGAPSPLLVSYASGFVSTIGAGAYDRSLTGAASPNPPPLQAAASGGGTLNIGVQGTLTIQDSRTYGVAGDVAVAGGELLVVKAAALTRPLLRFQPQDQEPHAWTITGSVAEGRSSLWLDGLFLSGADLVLAGEFDTVTISSSTLDPGTWDKDKFAASADGRALVASRIRVVGHVERLLISRSITGPVLAHGSGIVSELRVVDSIVQAHGAAHAITVASGLVTLERATVLGRGTAHEVDVSESILQQRFNVTDHQHGCVRFSAWTEHSRLPRKYESLAIPAAAALFASLRFGDPEYGQLRDDVSASIAQGAQNGSEMGAFAGEKRSIKERALRIKLSEYTPAGLAPVIVHMT